MTGKSQAIEAAERYLAGGGRWPEALGKAAGDSLPSGASRRWSWRELARRCRRRGREWLARLGRRSAPRPRLLSVAERLDLGAKKALMIVACGERRFLVASGGEAIAAMLEIRAESAGSRASRIRRIPAADRAGRRARSRPRSVRRGVRD